MRCERALRALLLPSGFRLDPEDKIFTYISRMRP
jgi:hypothetical protein